MTNGVSPFKLPGSLVVDEHNANNGSLNMGLDAGNGIAFGANSGEGIASKRTAGGNGYGLDFYTNSRSSVGIDHDGNLRIDNDVNTGGDVNVDGGINVGFALSDEIRHDLNVGPNGAIFAATDVHVGRNLSVNGNVTGDLNVTGDILLRGSDCAEEFDIQSDNTEPGTVMVLDQSGNLEESHCAYDKKVAGVISGAGTFRHGIVLGKQETDQKRMRIALMGKVYCKVDATFSPIEIGDLLTTSPTKGHAMKAEDPFKAFGAVIGKAMGSIKDGLGMIPVLVALQ